MVLITRVLSSESMEINAVETTHGISDYLTESLVITPSNTTTAAVAKSQFSLLK